MELLLGCGSTRDRRIAVNGKKGWTELVTLDVNPAHQPDIVHDLERLPWPFEDNQFDEVHCYEILEHLGRQGDYESFFAHFAELWRILKPDGCLAVTCPSYRSRWAWGDPGHRRVLTSGSLVFLSQEEYAAQVGNTAMADYRGSWKGDFRPLWIQEDQERFCFVLQALKVAPAIANQDLTAEVVET